MSHADIEKLIYGGIQLSGLMHEREKEAVANRVIELAEKAQSPFASGEKRSRLISSNGVSYSLHDESVDSLNTLISDLLIKDKFNERFSEEYMRAEVEGIISKLIKDGNSTSTAGPK